MIGDHFGLFSLQFWRVILANMTLQNWSENRFKRTQKQAETFY
jgi:hypothetical protein